MKKAKKVTKPVLSLVFKCNKCGYEGLATKVDDNTYRCNICGNLIIKDKK